MGNSTVTYSFNSYGLTVSIVVSTQLRQFQAVDLKTYNGYAIVSGTGQYTPTGGNPLTFTVSPQTVNVYNVLWATTDDGSGGSSHGIDTYGVNISGFDAQLSWSGASEGVGSFWISEDPINSAITLGKVKNWPPVA